LRNVWATRHLGAERLRLLQGLGVREDRFRDGRSQVATFLRVASLENHRLALRRALKVERAHDREVLALVPQRVLPGRVEEDAALLVPREGIGFVGVPQPPRDLHVLKRTAVAGGIVVALVAAVVTRCS
jgi:hypothetical protein